MTKAINFEREGSVEQAIPLMEEAVSVFNAQITLAGPDMKPILEMYQRMYAEKLETLKKPEVRLEDDFEVIN